MPSGWIFNTQRFSVHDGPGIRTTVFLKGCPLACVWCHNPEGIASGPELALSPKRCIACGECVAVCPEGLPVPGASPQPGSEGSCLVCGACAETCPSQARQVAGRRASVDEVIAEILKDRIFFEQSGGGATFSGGEPLWQPQFLSSLLAACKSEGIRTAVDTSGLAPWKDLESIAAITDLFLYDIKHLDDEVHRRYTGASNLQILSNLQRLGALGSRIWVRVPVIPGFNDAPSHLRAIGHLAAGIDGVERVCLLPYHPLGEDKLRRQGREAVLAIVDRPSDAQMQNLADQVAASGVTTWLGG